MIYPIGGCSTHPIIHVAVADMDATYGADVAAENNTFDINNTNKNANIKPVVSKVRGVYPVPQGKIEAPI